MSREHQNPAVRYADRRINELFPRTWGGTRPNPKDADPCSRIFARLGFGLVLIALIAVLLPHSSVMRSVEDLGLPSALAITLLIVAGTILLLIPPLLSTLGRESPRVLMEKEFAQLDPFAWQVIDKVHEGELFSTAIDDVCARNNVPGEKVEFLVLQRAKNAATYGVLTWRFRQLLDQLRELDSLPPDSEPAPQQPAAADPAGVRNVGACVACRVAAEWL